MQFDSTAAWFALSDLRWQGMMGRADGTYPVGSTIGDITVPFRTKSARQGHDGSGRIGCNPIPIPKDWERYRYQTGFLASAGAANAPVFPSRNPTLTFSIRFAQQPRHHAERRSDDQGNRPRRALTPPLFR